jgi:hypothetical protein
MNVVCPHCACEIWIEELNCRIFRHAVYISNMEPIPPHSSQLECERLVAESLVYGCAKPFRITEQNQVEICDYI